MSFGGTIISTVLGGPSTPVDTNAAANSIAEGAAVNTSVGVTAHSTSPSSSTVTYTLSADSSGGGFKIDPVTGAVTVADPSKIDFESAPGHAYTITTSASDGISSSSQSFTIAVTDVAPSTPVDSNAGANTVAEGAANGTAVGITAASTDVNGPAVTWSLTGDTSGGGFTINAATGVITVADGTKIDYETSPGHAYTVTATASDGTLTSSHSFTIAVTDVPLSTPVDTNAAPNSIAEGAAAGSTVGITASAVDPNGPIATYTLTGDTSGGGFTINAATGVVTVADPTKIDYESAAGHAYTITVQANDGLQTTSQNFTIGVTDVAPSTPVDLDGAPNTVAEGAIGGTLVGITASSIDVNGPAVTYSLTGDTSGGGFTINAVTGVISVANSSKVDYETAPGHAYTVTAQASDGTLTSSQTFTIAVSDVAPSTPVDSNAAGNGVAEGAANGSTVGITASSTDVNGPAVTYSLIGDTTGGGYTINATTGVVTVADGTKIDYESAPLHADIINVQASDGTLTSSQFFTIAVTDVAPSQPVDSDATANTVAEGAAGNTTVGVTASSTDVNGGLVTYVLTLDSSGGGFKIDPSTGVVSVANPGKIDYESSGAGHSYTVTVVATDGTIPGSGQTFTIGVTDVAPSTPVDSDAATNQVAVSAPVGTHVGVTASSTDVNGPAVTYSLVGDTSGGGFTINAATGVVTVADPSKILVADPSYDITVDSSDGTLHSQQTFTIAVVLDAAPVVTAGHTLNYTENQAATAIDPAVTVTDSDNANLAHATVQITGNYVNGEDVLGFTNQNGITGSFNAATGTMTLSGSSSVANYQTALESVTYFDNSDNPSGAARTVTITANDGTLDSAPATDTINVTPVNDPPVVVAGHTLNYTEDQAATAFDPSLAVTDVDNANLASATVQISGNYVNGQDILGFTNQNGITGSFNAATGTLTLTGSSSVANYQTALDSVTYFNNSDNPSGLARTVTIIANDGAANSVAKTDTINVTPVNDPPVTTAGGTLNYTENQAATAIDSSVTVSDVDNANLASATVQITGNYVNGQDVLAFTNQNGITGSFNAATGTLTLSGSSSVAHYQTALDSVTYFNNSDNPSGLDRIVSYTANDGALNSNTSTSTIHVTPVNDAPVVTFNTVNGFTEPPNGTPAANSVPVTIAPSLAVSDVDSTNLLGASFVLNDLKPSDALSVSGHVGSSGDIGGIHFVITATATTEIVTLTGTDTIAHYNSVLDLVQFNNTSENPDTTARSYTVTAQDDGGTSNGGIDTGSANANETVTAVNDPPTATVPSDASVGTAFSHTDLAISGLSVADVDAGSGNVTTTIASSHAGLNFTTTGLASFTNNGSHTVTLTGTVAQVNTALATLHYNSDDGFTGSDTVTLSVNDNGNTGTPGAQSSGNQTFHVGVVPQVFYIDNSSAGTNAGTQANPYTSIAAFNAANPAGTGDYVVLEHGTGTYTEANGINLANGVNLIGGDETLQFTNPVTSAVVTANIASGAAPIIKVSSGSDSGIDLLGTTGHIIEGVSVDTTAGTGIGISDDGNNVGTVTMSDIVVKTSGGAGLNFTHGGTLTVTGAANSISSTTGTALDIANTTIGSSNVTFHDISSNGAVHGIVLNTTGSSGGLIVTGDGGASSNHSGGQILNSTGDGVSLNSTSNVNLGYIDINNGSADGIHGDSVNNLTLNHDNVLNTGTNTTTSEGLKLGESSGTTVGVTGAVSITNSSISGSGLNNVHIRDTSGTISSLTVTGDTFDNVGLGEANSFLFEGSGTSVLTSASFTGNTLANNGDTAGNGGQGLAHALTVQAHDTATVGTFTASGNTFTNNGVQADFDQDGSANLTFKFLNNGTALAPMTGSDIQAINVFTSSTSTGGTLVGTIQGNHIGSSTAESGSVTGGGIRAEIQGHTDATLLIDSNVIQGYDGGNRGIDVEDPGPTSATGPVVTSDVTITNNTVTPGPATAASGFLTGASIFVGADNQSGSDATAQILRADIHGNVVPVSTVDGEFLSGQIQYYQFTGTNADGIGQLVGTLATASAQLAATNTGSTSASEPGDSPPAVGITVIPGPITTPPLFAASGGVQASSPTPGETNLTQAELDSVVAAAIAEWAAAGATASQLAALHAVTFTVADLSGSDLSGNIIGEENSPTHITIDDNAAGHGWFVDPTPSSNSEFTHAQNDAGTDLLTDPSNAAAGHLDLLTAVTHELGHVLGLPDSTATSDAHDLMYINLVDGERRLPDAADVTQANAIAVHAIEAGLPASAQAATSAPIVVGTPGNDTIDAGLGGKILIGGGGADNFVFGPDIHLGTATAPAAQPITHVADYSAAQGDTFDFSALTTAFHASGIADNSLVRAVEDSSGTFSTLQLNTNATPAQPAGFGAPAQPGVPNWVNVAQLDGAHAGDAVNVLLDSHLAVHVAQIHVDLLV